jgi:xanthosine utilization system XapX-like protein
MSNPKVRKGLYAVQMIVGGVVALLSIFGILEQDVADQIVTTIAGLVALTAGRVASANLSPKPAVIGADGVARITDALAAYAKNTTVSISLPEVGSAAAAVEQARRDLEARLGAARRQG